MYLSDIVNYTSISFSVVDPMCMKEASIIWGLDPKNWDLFLSGDSLSLGNYWTLFFIKKSRYYLYGCGVYVLQVYSESSFLMFTSLVRKEFLSFIWECSTFLTHYTSNTHHTASHRIHQATLVKERERGWGKKKPCT